MAFSSISTPSSAPPNLLAVLPNSSLLRHPRIILSIPSRNSSVKQRLLSCCAVKQQSGPPVKKRTTTNTKRKKKTKNVNSNASERKSSSRYDDDDEDDDNLEDSPGDFGPMLQLKPPAGFVLDEQGRVLMASNKRLVTIVDSANNSPLECVVRRVFRSKQGKECMLLCPVDMPVHILKSTNEGWSAVSDEEVDAILPNVAYALAKIHIHLVHSGFCYTARGGFCYTEDDILEFCADDGEDLDGLPTEGIEITCFHVDGSHYMVYTPADPLLFVAFRDENGELQIADDELLGDPAILGAIDEETQFTALVEQEAALLESLLGERQ